MRKPTAAFIRAVLAAGAVLIGSNAPSFAAEPSSGDTAGAGEALYRTYCYQCHGYAGDARTLASTSLVPPPRDFTGLDATDISVDEIERTIRHGRPGTAMAAFDSVLDAGEARAVAEYVHAAFVRGAALATRYHTPANGWNHHANYRDADPFVTGEVPLSLPWERLDERQRRGRRLYETACVSCHVRPLRVGSGAEPWQSRAVSWPRRHFSHRADTVDLVAAASPYAVHDRSPEPGALSATERAGRELYEANCAFCHARDGSARNWIGSFLEPRPRDFSAAEFAEFAEGRLRTAIRDGVAGSSMPAWGSVLCEAEIDSIVAYLRAAFVSPRPMPGAAPE